MVAQDEKYQRSQQETDDRWHAIVQQAAGETKKAEAKLNTAHMEVQRLQQMLEETEKNLVWEKQQQIATPSLAMASTALGNGSDPTELIALRKEAMSLRTSVRSLEEERSNWNLRKLELEQKQASQAKEIQEFKSSRASTFVDSESAITALSASHAAELQTVKQGFMQLQQKYLEKKQKEEKQHGTVQMAVPPSTCVCSSLLC